MTMKGYLYSIYECENGDFVGCGSNGTGWFTRFDSEGNMLWKNNTPTNTGSFASTIESSDGGLVFVGSFINISSGNIDAYVLKTSPTGHLIWNITYTDASIVGPVQMFASSVMESSAGDLIIAGWSVYADAYTMCISQTGTIIWAPGKDGNNDAYYDPGGGLIGIFFLDNLVECPDGGFVIAGAAGEQSNASSYGIWVVKTSSLGILEWQRLYRNVSVRINGYASAISITRTESSGFAILYSAMTAGGNYTTRLLRINENGTKLWEELYSGWGHYIGTAIVSTEYGGYLMVGYYEYPPYDYDKAWLKLLRPVQWTEIPIDRSVEYGNSFSYSFEVPTEPSDPHTDEFGGHYYTFYEDLLTWRSAQSVCQNMFGHLATISSSAENAFVFSLVDEVDSSVHLGGFDQTDAQNWEWVTRESWSYTNWSSGEPNLPTTENYLEMLSSGFWNNVPHSVQTYVCEWDYDYWNYYCGVNDSRFSVSRVGSYFEITNQTQLSVGEYQLRIKVSDGGGDFICKTITVTVESSAPPEWIEQPANQNLEFGSMFDITLLAGDRTGIGSWWLNDTENFDIDSGQISSNGVLAIGQYPIEVQVADVLGNTAVAEFVITVADTTAPEFISEPVNQVFEYGELLVYNIGATDLSGIDKWWLSDATHISVSEDGILEQNYVLPVGLYPLDIFVNDTQGNIRSASITLTVSLDPSIWIIDPEDQIAEFYQDFKYSLIAYAPGDFSEWWLNDSINFNIDNGGVVSNATTLEVGTYGLHVIATLHLRG
jgi:hypothetical protein